MSPHATVMVDGLGGYSPYDCGKVRIAQVATGAYLAGLIETVACHQEHPARFMVDYYQGLLTMLDQAVRSAVWIRGKEQQEKLWEMDKRAAFIAVARFKDGVVVFGVGDCMAHIYQRGAHGALQRVSFVPQPGDVSPRYAAGLGSGELSPKQCRLWHCTEPERITRVILASDGVFNDHNAFVRLAPAGARHEPTGRVAVLEELSIGEAPREDALDEIVTALTQRARADAASQRAHGTSDWGAHDAAGIVIRDFDVESPAGKDLEASE